MTVVTESFHELSLPIVEEKCPTTSNRKNVKPAKHKSESESEEEATKVAENKSVYNFIFNEMFKCKLLLIKCSTREFFVLMPWLPPNWVFVD